MIKANANIASIWGQRQPKLARMEEIIRLSGGGQPSPEFFSEYYDECFGSWITSKHIKLLDQMKAYYKA